MEHKLITGGEQFLPFARSRIKALRATGLKYASQQFEIDGCSVKVRIEPGHEYITLEGSAIELKMDSGVVDMVAFVGVFGYNDHPANFLPRPLYRTTHNEVYEAKFTNVSNSGWVSNPVITSSGQAAGEVKFFGSSIRGRIPMDEKDARSFLPWIEENTETDPPTFGLKETDSNIYTKKETALACPASIFTGRCRLYVQAMYGRYMHDGRVSGDGTLLSASVHATPIQYSLSGQFGWPSLRIRPYMTDEEIEGLGDSPLPPDVVIDTCSGIYHDTLTGKHWLIQPGDTTRIYPLIAERSGESVRKYLVASKYPKLSDDDREHIEAYILSTCRPHASQVELVATGSGLPNYSLGYGWHWNWSGTEASIVKNVAGRSVPSPDGFQRVGMTSWLYSIRVVPIKAASDEKITWAATSSVDEGPVEWAVNRGTFAIAEPTWVSMTMEKALPRYSIFMECDAPFYVFYRRNEIQVCRIKSKRTAPTQEVVESPMFGGPSSQAAAGLTAGFWQSVATPEKFDISLSVGGSTIGGVTVFLGVESRQRIDRAAGSVVAEGEAKPYAGGLSYSNFADGLYAKQGGELTPFSGTFNEVFYPECSITGWSDIIVEYPVTTKVSKVTTYGAIVSVIPRHDSQALFASHSSGEVETVVSYAEAIRRTAAAVFRVVPIQGVVERGVTPEGTPYAVVTSAHALDPVERTVWNTLGMSSEISRKNLEALPVPAAPRSDKLLCVGGAIEADMGDLRYYLDAEDECYPEFWAKSGARSTSPTVISHQRIAPVGTTVDSTTMATLVGWI